MINVNYLIGKKDFVKKIIESINSDNKIDNYLLNFINYLVEHNRFLYASNNQEFAYFKKENSVYLIYTKKVYINLYQQKEEFCIELSFKINNKEFIGIFKFDGKNIEFDDFLKEIKEKFKKEKKIIFISDGKIIKFNLDFIKLIEDRGLSVAYINETNKNERTYFVVQMLQKELLKSKNFQEILIDILLNDEYNDDEFLEFKELENKIIKRYYESNIYY
jgi:hypothetical protein